VIIIIALVASGAISAVIAVRDTGVIVAGIISSIEMIINATSFASCTSFAKCASYYAYAIIACCVR
jgi:hypothetical protein